MKALESKYIDLANFYKQELVYKNGVESSNGSSKSAVGGVISALSQEARPSRNEDAFISDLKNEKMRFESNIQAIINRNGRQDMVTIESYELVRFNMELEKVFVDMAASID